MRKNLGIVFFSLSSYFLVHAQGLSTRTNLGPNVNSPTQTDAHPCLSADGKRLYFSRQNTGSQYDIYFSDLGADNKWSPAKKIDELNNDSDNGVKFAYPDGNRLIIRGVYDGKNGFFETSFDGNKWSKPTLIKFETEPSWDNNSLALSTSGKVMVISNSADLYVSFLKADGVWTSLKPITGLNTKDYEYTVYMASDDATLYFSGNGYESMGQNDILKTTRLDDTWMNWSKPAPLDNTINSADWESYFALSASGEFAIVYSRKEGDGDIYSVPLTEVNKPKPVALIKGNVLNGKTKAPLKATITYDLLQTGANAGTATSNEKDGHYNVVLQYGKKYVLAANAENYFAVSDMLDLTAVNSYQEIQKDILLYPIEVGQTIRLENIFFETNKSELKDESKADLDRLVTVLKSKPDLKIEIGGHTDDIGSTEANKALSQARVNAVVDYLTANGIDRKQLKGIGYGESKPEVKNENDEARARNRRVEFTVMSK